MKGVDDRTLWSYHRYGPEQPGIVGYKRYKATFEGIDRVSKGIVEPTVDGPNFELPGGSGKIDRGLISIDDDFDLELEGPPSNPSAVRW